MFVLVNSSLLLFSFSLIRFYIVFGCGCRCRLFFVVGFFGFSSLLAKLLFQIVRSLCIGYKSMATNQSRFTAIFLSFFFFALIHKLYFYWPGLFDFSFNIFVMAYSNPTSVKESKRDNLLLVLSRNFDQIRKCNLCIEETKYVKLHDIFVMISKAHQMGIGRALRHFPLFLW